MAFDNLKLEKGLYQEALKEGKTFAQKLEEIDPTAGYKGTEHDGLDAFQRQLKRFGIRVKGAKSDVVEKFFQTTESAVLFPEFIARMVREGLEEKNILPSIIATTTNIDSDSYRSIYMDVAEDDKKLRRVAEGAKIPVTKIKTKENVVNVFKYGRTLEASYEALRRKKVDVVSVFLRQIGAQILRDQLIDAVDVIINGDDNNNSAASYTVGTDPITGVAGTVGYDQILDFWAEFEPYEMNTILAPKAMLLGVLKLDEFKDPQAGFNFQKTGQLMSPLGANLNRLDAVPAGKIIGMDKRYCLEFVVEQGVMTEYDKIIDRQLEQTVISQVAGFAKLFKEAAKVLNKQ